MIAPPPSAHEAPRTAQALSKATDLPKTETLGQKCG